MSARIIVEIREGLSVSRIERTVETRFSREPALLGDVRQVAIDAAVAASTAHAQSVEVR